MLAAWPLSTLAQIRFPSAVDPFKVEAGKSRFPETLTFRAVNKQDIKVSKTDTDALLSILEYTGNEQAGPPLHIHFHQDEIFYIAEGEYRFVIGSQEILAKKGDTLFAPRNIPHTWMQLSKKGKQFYILQPSGTFEEFLRELQNLKTPPGPDELQAIHLKHGMKVLGPPLSVRASR